MVNKNPIDKNVRRKNDEFSIDFGIKNPIIKHKFDA